MKKQTNVVGRSLRKIPLLLPVTTLDVPGAFFCPDQSFKSEGSGMIFPVIGEHFRECFLGCNEERVTLPSTLQIHELSQPAYDSQITRNFEVGRNHVIDIAHFLFFLGKLWDLSLCFSSLNKMRWHEYISIAYVWTPQGYVVAVSATWHYRCRGIHIAAATTPDSCNGYEWPKGTQIVSYV